MHGYGWIAGLIVVGLVLVTGIAARSRRPRIAFAGPDVPRAVAIRRTVLLSVGVAVVILLPLIAAGVWLFGTILTSST